MIILQVNDHCERVGGAETLFFAILEGLEARGVDNRVVYQHGTPGLEMRWPVQAIPALGAVSCDRGGW